MVPNTHTPHVQVTEEFLVSLFDATPPSLRPDLNILILAYKTAVQSASEANLALAEASLDYEVQLDRGLEEQSSG